MKENKKGKRYLHLDEQDDRSQKTVISDWEAIKYLGQYTKSQLGKFILSSAAIILSALLQVVAARLMGTLVEEGLIPRNYEQSIFIAGAIVILEFIALGLLWRGRKLLAVASSKAILEIRKNLFIHLEKLPMRYFDHQPQGRVITRLTHDVEGLESFFTQIVGRLGTSLLLAITTLIAMIVTHWVIGLYMFLSLIPTLAFIFLTRNKVGKINRGLSRSSAGVNARLSEYVSGIEVIRSFAIEDWSMETYKEEVEEYRSNHLAANAYFSILRPFIIFLCSLPILTLIFYSGPRILEGTLTVGLFVTFLRFGERFFNPITVLSREIHAVQLAMIQAERITLFFKEKTEDLLFEMDNKEIVNPKTLAGKIEFDTVSMSYGRDIWALRDISFTIKAGETVGIIGRTGSGKTTTTSLLSRLYPFQKGEIYLDDQKITSMSISYIRSQIGMVGQEVVIFKGSILDNLCLGLEIEIDELDRITQKTGLYGILEEKGYDYNSQLTEGGQNLSVGERQLLALTRILIRKPSILILDEATANIDLRLEKLIQKAMQELASQCTCLIIAHRPETLEICDSILSFSDGTVSQYNRLEFFKNNDLFNHLESYLT